MENGQIALPLTAEEDKIAKPLTQVLDHITPKPSPEYVPKLEDSKSFTESLDELFPEQQYDKKLQKAKETLGSLAEEFSSPQLKETVIKMEFLVSSWLDDYERKIFEGLTLKELLHEKGGI